VIVCSRELFPDFHQTFIFLRILQLVFFNEHFQLNNLLTVFVYFPFIKSQFAQNLFKTENIHSFQKI